MAALHGEFVELAVVFVAVGAELLRGVVTGVLIVFVTVEAASSNPVATDGAAFVAYFPSAPFACCFDVVELLADAFADFLPSLPLYSEEKSSWF